MTLIDQRMKVVQKVRALISEKHVNPFEVNYDYARWRESLEAKARGFCSGSDEDFERGLEGVLAELGTSHLALIRKKHPGTPPTFALNAGLVAVRNGTSWSWMFRDIVEDGPADRAGIRSGDLLIALDGVAMEPGLPGATSNDHSCASGSGSAIRTANMPLFKLGTSTVLSIGQLSGGTPREIKIDLPNSKSMGRPPLVEPKAVSSRYVGEGVGHLRIAYFPGAIGYRFIQDLESAIQTLHSQGARRFVLDLRGNPGGGLGSLRVMSLLASQPIPVGYSLTRLAIRKGWTKERLPQVDRIPTTTLEKLGMFVRFKVFHRDRSLVLRTETIVPSPLADSTVLLVNDGTKSAAEMVAAFCKEHRLAPIVGDHTPGQVLGAVNFKLSAEYSLRMPTATWHTWGDVKIEGVGVAPDHAVDLDPFQFGQTRDTQLERAIQIALAL